MEREGKKPLVARFGGIPLKRQKWAEIQDLPKTPYIEYIRTELVQRMLADECELCGSTTKCEVHHIRKLADLNVKGQKEKPNWMKAMAARHRKTLIVCLKCHKAIHAGRVNQLNASGE